MMPFGFNDVRGKVLANTDTISGRVYVLGLSVVPTYYPATETLGIKVDALVKLYNGSSATGDPLIQVPVVMTEAYPTDMGFDYVEHGGYVLFPDGLYAAISASTGAVGDISLSVYYQV
jgi:hypothetical protein